MCVCGGGGGGVYLDRPWTVQKILAVFYHL